jgi:hypothetical protein
VAARSGPFPEMKFFTGAEQACAGALLTGQVEREGGLVVPVLEMIDARLAADATRRCGTPFAEAADADIEQELPVAGEHWAWGDPHG